MNVQSHNTPRSRFVPALAALLLAACAAELETPASADTPELRVEQDNLLFVPPTGAGVTNGLLGEYYDNMDFTALMFTRVDTNVSFDWGSGSPDPRMGSNTFSIRWSGYFTPPTTGSYTFRTTSDDGSRLFIDGVRIVDNWGDHGTQSRDGAINVVAGQSYRFEVQYYENGGGANMRLQVSTNGGSTFTDVPATWFTSSGNGTGLSARWWNSRADLESGATPAATTIQASPIVYDSPSGLPAALHGGEDPPAGVAADQFAVRMTGYLEPPTTGSYQFAVECQGPYVLWLDNSAVAGVAPFVLDQWAATPTGAQTLTISLTAGSRVGFRLDYADQAGDGNCLVGWKRPLLGGGTTPEFEFIPTTALYPAALGVGNGLTARYYDNQDFTNLVYKRTDRTVNYDWGVAAPTFADGTTMGSDTFSIVWTGEVQPIYSETYTFHVRHDDGVRLWVDNVLLINQWATGSRDSSGTITLAAGQKVSIRLEYFESSNSAFCELGWSSPSQFRQIIPQSQLFPETVNQVDGAGLEGHYFDNENFTAFHTMRIDPSINFNWGNASPFPSSSFGADTFSVRWLGQVRPRYSETYTFETWSDDGVRLWVNNQLIIDNWTTHSTTQDLGTIDLVAGKRYDIRMEYFERSGGAVARLLWQSPSQALEVIPDNRLYPPPALGTGDGLLGEYYGAPDLDDRDLRLVRIDPWLAFTYADTPPVDVLPPRNHSMRWTGTFESVYDETYRISLVTNGGVRMWIEGVLVIDQFTDPGTAMVEHGVDFDMETGQLYDIQVEYTQADQGGQIQLWWESPSQVRQLVPKRQMYAATPNARIEFGECESVIEIDDFSPPEGQELPDGLTINGGLTLSGETLRSPDLWVANTSDNTVTRFNTTDGSVVGTYPVGWNPSRTAVDLNYDVWVANRSFGWWEETNGIAGTQSGGTNPDTYHARMGTVTKLLHDCACPEDGSICSECVDFTVNVGNDSVPRGLAIDARNNVWVGTWNTQQLFKVDSRTGVILGQFNAPVRPYGLAIDREGKIWIAEINRGIGCFDTVTERPCGVFTSSVGIVRGEGTNCMAPYGIAVDGQGNVWFGNWNCHGLGRIDRASYNASVLANTDPLAPIGGVWWGGVTARVDFFNHANGNQTRGVAVDGQGRIWTASSYSDRLLQYDPASNQWIGSYPANNNPIGVGISDTGDALAVAQSGPNSRGRVYAYSPTGQLQWFQDAGRSSYSYSDMTGFQLRNFTAPQGTWNHVFDCSGVSEPGCVFDYMTWDAIVPNGTQVMVRLRVGERSPDNEPIWGEWSPHFSATPAPLGRAGYAGQFVEVEVTLVASPTGYAPTMHAVQLWRCPQIYAPDFFDVDDRWIISQTDRNYGISWQIRDDSWPETRWEFIDEDGHMRCLLDSQTSITKGQLYQGTGAFPSCVETHLLSNVPVTRSVRTALFDVDTGEWRRSPATDPVTYYTLVNDPTAANADMRILGQTDDSVYVNWCRPQNNWSAGITGARVVRWTGTATTPDPGSLTVLADFPAAANVYGTARGYASDTTPCGTLHDTGLQTGTRYFYQLQYQNGDGVPSQPLVLDAETYGRPCCDELAEGCVGVCVMAVTGPTGCEYPSAHENPELTCDDLDNDCDGQIDEGLTNACGYCGPAPVEVCDGIDNDCDGTIDQNPVAGPTFYWDGDGDTWGDIGRQSTRCSAGGGWVARAGDCNDANAAINPGAAEICDGIDNDCDGLVDEDGGLVTYYRDADGDGFGNRTATTLACAVPAGYVANDTDCDDTRNTVYPGAPEVCDGLDNDCDGETDEGWANVDLDIVQVTTTADMGTGRCENGYAGLACEGSFAIEFMVSNSSAYTVPANTDVDFRIGGPTGSRVVAPIRLGRAVEPRSNSTFVFCFGMERTGTHDMWIGMPNLGSSMPLCAPANDVERNVPFNGGTEICDGQDNDCDGVVDDNSCGVTQICVQTLVGDYRCVAAMTEEGECEGGECVIACETDGECGEGAECRDGTCVDQRWLAGSEQTAASAASAVDPVDGHSDAPGARDPGSSGCSTTDGGRSTSAGWAGTLLVLMMVRRRRCRGERQA